MSLEEKSQLQFARNGHLETCLQNPPDHAQPSKYSSLPQPWPDGPAAPLVGGRSWYHPSGASLAVVKSENDMDHGGLHPGVRGRPRARQHGGLHGEL